ncbi:MAG: hypothetical protein ACRD1V_05280 [Vicinamibacterales bacterium]
MHPLRECFQQMKASQMAAAIERPRNLARYGQYCGLRSSFVHVHTIRAEIREGIDAIVIFRMSLSVWPIWTST